MTTPITINGVTIDPAAPKPTLAALSLHNKNAKDSDYVLVQTKHPLNREERTKLAKAGAKILEAVPGARSSATSRRRTCGRSATSTS